MTVRRSPPKPRTYRDPIPADELARALHEAQVGRFCPLDDHLQPCESPDAVWHRDDAEALLRALGQEES